jgi:hypothetical protein
MEFGSGHRGHMHVSDQASRLDETWGYEEIGRRRENLYGEAQ